MRSIDSLERTPDSAALGKRLDAAEMATLDEALAPGRISGPRYQERTMATIDRGSWLRKGRSGFRKSSCSNPQYWSVLTASEISG